MLPLRCGREIRESNAKRSKVVLGWECQDGHEPGCCDHLRPELGVREDFQVKGRPDLSPDMWIDVSQAKRAKGEEQSERTFLEVEAAQRNARRWGEGALGAKSSSVWWKHRVWRRRERCYVSPECEGLVIKEHIKNLGLYPKVSV